MGCEREGLDHVVPQGAVAVPCMEAAEAPAVTLQRRIQRAVATDLQDDVLKEAVSYWTELQSRSPPSASDGDPPADYGLLSVLEMHNLSMHTQFIQALAGVLSKFSAVEAEAKSIGEASGALSSRISASVEHTKQLLSEADTITKERAFAHGKEELCHAFLSHFRLNADELATLQSGIVNEKFFAVVARIRLLRDRCQTLLRGPNHRAGLEISENLARVNEEALKIAFHFAQEGIRRMIETGLDLPAFFSASVCLLREQSPDVLCRSWMEELTAQLSAYAVREFLDALSTGGSGRAPPIDLHAHDSVRYVGDMLAWTHQQSVLVRDVLRSLLAPSAGPVGGSKSSSSVAVVGSVSDASTKALLDDVMSGAFEGVARHLRVRLSQIIDANPPPLSMFRLSNIMGFYRGMVAGQFGSASAPLPLCIAQMGSATDDALVGFLKIRADRLTAEAIQVPSDLSAPPLLGEALRLVEEIGHEYEANSLVSREDRAALDTVLSALVDPLLQISLSASEGLGGDDAPVLLINSLGDIHQVLAMNRCTEARAAQVSLNIEDQLRILMDRQAESVLTQCGLSTQLSRVRSGQPLNGDELAGTVRSFYESLFTMGAMTVPSAERIVRPAVREEARVGVARRIAKAYAEVYAAAVAEGSGITDPRAALYHTPAQVAELLGCELLT